MTNKGGSSEGQTAGVGNVMMGNVMMGSVIETPLMGSTAEGYNDYSDNSYDFTNAYAGEMDF